MYAAQGWHLSCFVFWHWGPRKQKKTLSTYASGAGAATRLSARGESLGCDILMSQSTLNIRWCRNFGKIGLTFQFIVQSRQAALFCESEASRRNFFAGGGAIESGSADVDVASVSGVTLPGV